MRSLRLRIARSLLPSWLFDKMAVEAWLDGVNAPKLTIRESRDHCYERVVEIDPEDSTVLSDRLRNRETGELWP